MTLWGKKRLPAPTLVRPRIVTLAIRRQRAPSETSGPTMQKGPTSTSDASFALGSITARGEIFGMSCAVFAVLSFSLQRFGIDQHELDVRLARQLLPHERLAAHVTGSAFDA